MPLRKFGLYCGIISPILWLALIATAGVLRPDFSHLTQYISELAERGSATEALMRYGAFGLTGLLYLCFAGALLATFRNGWLSRAALFRSPWMASAGWGPGLSRAILAAYRSP